jgi:hypothetical protein
MPFVAVGAPHERFAGRGATARLQTHRLPERRTLILNRRLDRKQARIHEWQRRHSTCGRGRATGNMYRGSGPAATVEPLTAVSAPLVRSILKTEIVPVPGYAT